MSGTARKWDDLNTRITTAIVLIAVAGGALLLGGVALTLIAALACGLMFWELAQMISPPQRRAPIVLGIISGVAVLSLLSPVPFIAVAVLPVLLGAVWLRKDRLIFLFYGALIMLGCLSVVLTRNVSAMHVVWLVTVVIASDVAGYVFGRLLGGPKFWPRVSPKKTWSGTIGGWISAACVGVGFAGALGGNIIIASVILCFAAQLGDIAESAIKRHVGIKDSSNLLPGHGGLLDRFDGMIAAFAVWILLAPLVVASAGVN